MEHKKIIGSIVGVPNPRPDWNQNDKTKADYIKNKPTVYTKNEVKDLLSRKADVGQITNVYRYCGSVDTFEDLPKCYEFVPCGNPTIDGIEIGTFDAEEGTITLNEPMVLSGYVIKIPVEMTVAKGSYYIKNDTTHDLLVIGNYSFTEYPLEIGEETAITYIMLGAPADDIEYSGTYKLGGLYSCYTDEYGLAVPIYPSGGDVYNVLDTDVNYAWTGTDWDALGGEYKDLEAREQIAEISTELDKKANKSDVVSAYTFKGSVDTFDDLPKVYEFIPCGNPTVDGIEVGTFDAKNGTITLDRELILDGWSIRVPIVEIVAKKGQYYIDEYDSDVDVLGFPAYYHYASLQLFEIDADTKITEIYIGAPANEQSYSGTYRLGKMYSGYHDDSDTYEPLKPIDRNNGDVYEVKESGLSYGWTGSTWDALGTSHIDEYAREQIATIRTETDALIYSAELQDGQITELQNNVGDIETALDLIIEIQNSLIGGDGE